MIRREGKWELQKDGDEMSMVKKEKNGELEKKKENAQIGSRQTTKM